MVPPLFSQAAARRVRVRHALVQAFLTGRPSTRGRRVARDSARGFRTGKHWGALASGVFMSYMHQQAVFGSYFVAK